ncbi:MAG: DUF882 domain-containing protein [Hyphomicrobiales bacterium]|nr:DUF882 domain-containing protein [Hyphomicrobiales bacterium]
MNRRLLFGALSATVCGIAAISLSGFATSPVAASDERAVALYNIHTKETLSLVFKRDGKYVPEALEKFNTFMRDWRRNVSTKMDPVLLDLMWDIHRELKSQKPIHVISGHRSGATNEKMRRSGGGQAKGSRHITGQAADIHFPDVAVKQLRNSALVREKGGVGYYPTSALPFIHIDTGNVRHWPRIPRQELAILFPSGKSQHTPTDGHPITRDDFRIALAKLEASGGTLPIVTQRLLNRSPAPAAPAPILASLGPTSLTFGSSRKQEEIDPSVPRLPMLSARPAVTPEPRVEPYLQQTPVPVIRQPSLVGPQMPQQPDFSRGFVTAALPRNADAIDDDQIARAPDYDDDHPDEESYQPFPILPLLTDSPLAYADFSKEARPVVRKLQVLFSDADATLSVGLERGSQYEGMFWAQRFTGKAVSGAISKFVANESTSSTITKTASNVPAPAR